MEAGELLCQIDLEDLDVIISGKESEIEKLDAQMDSILQNEELAKQKKELELARAQEDYELQTRIGDTKVGRATESYVQAQGMLERAQENGLSEEEQIALEQSIQQSAYAESDAMAQRDADNRHILLLSPQLNIKPKPSLPFPWRKKQVPEPGIRLFSCWQMKRSRVS